MLDKTVISYTRSTLKGNPELVGALGPFEVYYGSAGKEPGMSFITLEHKRSKSNDPVQTGFLYINIYTANTNHEKLIEAANIVESLMDELVFPGGGAIRTYLKDLDFMTNPSQRTVTALMLFSLRGVNF